MNLSFLHLIIQFLANSCAARASSWSFVRFFSLSSIMGYLVFSKDKGIVIGVVPMMRLKGVCCWSECLRLLCVNSIVPSFLCQVSGCEEQ